VAPAVYIPWLRAYLETGHRAQLPTQLHFKEGSLSTSDYLYQWAEKRREQLAEQKGAKMDALSLELQQLRNESKYIHRILGYQVE